MSKQPKIAAVQESGACQGSRDHDAFIANITEDDGVVDWNGVVGVSRRS